MQEGSSAMTSMTDVGPTVVDDSELSFRITVDEEATAVFRRHRNQELFTVLMPSLEKDLDAGVDFEEIVDKWTSSMSVNKSSVRDLLRGLSVMTKMPISVSLAVEYGHIDESRLYAIGRLFGHLDSEQLPHGDRYLAQLLRPGVGKQELVKAEALGNSLEKFLREKNWETVIKRASTPRAAMRIDEDNNFRITLTVSRPEGAQLQEKIRKTAKARRWSLGQAVYAILNGDIERPNAILHLYQHPGGQIYLRDYGWLSKEELNRINITSTDLLEDTINTDKYAVPAALRALVIGRDGGCRAPGCGAAASKCDVDHVIPYDQGGTTTLDNLHLLCRHCHNNKTKGYIRVTMKPNGTDYWTLQDGTEVTTIPCGPWAEQIVANRTVTVPEDVDLTHCCGEGGCENGCGNGL